MAKPVIVVVDDEPQVLAAIERDLRTRYAKDYRLVRASSGAEALDVARRLKERSTAVALFLSDQRMPEMEGTELLARTREIFPAARRALLTAYADTQAAIDAINRVGLDYYLMKPWDPPDQKLFPVLDDLLSDWAANTRLPYEGMRVVGATWSPPSFVVKEFLSRNQVPYLWLDVDRDAEAVEIRDACGAKLLPIVRMADGTTLVAPTTTEIAERVGLQTQAAKKFYDLVIIGGGPAGLAGAVYGGSEGLSTVLIEKKAPGGQAGTSSFIENYLGFPKGLTGDDLARRAATQARRFGVEILTPREVTSLTLDGNYRIVRLDDGTEITCHAVLYAAGMDTRKLDLPGVDRFTGRGLFYGASLTEAVTYRGQDMFVVGAANSAGQGALFFARHARRVTMLVRGDSLEKGMSQYLVDQIRAVPNIEVLLQTEIAEVHGEEKLDSVTLVRSPDATRERREAGAVFVFVGAVPHSEVLRGVVELDRDGFVLTGRDLMNGGKRPSGWPLERDPLHLETSVPGIFAAGDVRAGTIKRVATAVGEGANAIALVHRHLETV